MNPTILGVIGPGFLNPVRTLYGSNKGCFESLLFRSFQRPCTAAKRARLNGFKNAF